VVDHSGFEMGTAVHTGADFPAIVALACLSLGLMANPAEAAEDHVTYATGVDGRGRAVLSGTVLDYTGQSLTLRSTSGSDQAVPASRVIEVQTQWHPRHAEGDQLAQLRRFDEALAAYSDALKDELRVWVQRKILAGSISCLTELGRWDRAGEVFLRLAQSDPQTQYFDRIPLSWYPQTPSPTLESKAVAWLGIETNPVAQLLGASWLLSGPRRPQAIAALQSLGTAGDPRLTGLAAAQLWRTRVGAADPNELQRWEALLPKIPAELRGGPYFTLGMGLAARGQSEPAALALLRVPILYPADRRLGAKALLSAGRELEKISRAEEALLLYREVMRDPVDPHVTAEAKSRLDELAPEKPD
jgi:tetratricopeptide (TPR) repeat protein